MRQKKSGVFQDKLGNCIFEGTISVYLAGTTTPASVYATETGTTVVNSVTTDQYGKYTFYVDRFTYDAEQQFKIVASKTGFTSITEDYIDIDDTVIKTYSIDANQSVSTHLVIPKGVVYQIATGVTLTFTGPQPEIGDYQVFSCVGTGAVAGLRKSRPEWFGAVGDLATDDGAAIRSAYAALTFGNLILMRTYLIDSADDDAGVVLANGKFIVGIGQPGCQLKAGANFPAKPFLYLPPGAAGQHVQLKDFYAVADAASLVTHAIELDTSQSSFIANVKVYSFTNGSAVRIETTTSHTSYFNVVMNIYVYDCKDGIEIVGSATNAPNVTTIIGGEIVGLTHSETGLKLDGSAGSVVGGTKCIGLDVENTFSVGLVSLNNSIGNDISVRTEQSSSTTLVLAGGSTIDNNNFDGMYEGNDGSYMYGRFSHAKSQVISATYGIITPANVRAFYAFAPNGTATTETDHATIGGVTAHTATYRDGSLDALAPPHWTPNVAGLASYYKADVTHLWNTPDAADLSAGNGSADSAISVLVLAIKGASANGVLVGKMDFTAGSPQREWYLVFDTSKLYFICYDNSEANAYIGRGYNTALTGDVNSPHVYAVTKSTDPNSASIKLYRDGVRIDDIDVEAGSYTAMEDTTALVGSYALSAAGAITYPFSGKEILVLVVAQELTAIDVARISVAWRGYAGAF